MISFIVDFVANIILFVSGVYLLLWAIGTYGQWVERKRGKRRGKLPWSWEREKANHRNLHRVVSLFRAVRERREHPLKVAGTARYREWVRKRDGEAGPARAD